MEDSQETRIASIKIIPYSLQFIAPFFRANGDPLCYRRGFIVKLEDHRGFIGEGDCAPLPENGSESLDEAEQAIKSALNIIINPYRFPAAAAAWGQAMLDLQAKSKGISILELLSANHAKKIKVNALLGSVLASDIEEKVARAIVDGYNILKIKVGISGYYTSELNSIRKLSQSLPDGILLRLDANRGWPREKLPYILQALNELPIESLEEPANIPINELTEYQNISRFSLGLDESISLNNIQDIIKYDYSRRLIVKPSALGGINHIYQLLKPLLNRVELVVTSMLESGVGIWNAVYLAALLDPESRQHHGLGTSSFFINNIGSPPIIVEGEIVI